MKRILATVLVLAGLLTRAAAMEVPATFAADMDRVMAYFARMEHFSGVVLIAREGKVLYAKAFGEADKGHHILNTLQTKFELGSISKLFTGIAFMRLVEKGVVKLGDPVRLHLPEFPFGDDITLLHLLTHTSGLPDWTGHPDFLSLWPRLRKIHEMLPLIFGQKLKRNNPGQVFEYNSSGFILLGAIMERISGKSFAEYIAEDILVPFGLNDTRVANIEQVVENRATGYVKTSTGAFRTNVYYLLPFIASAGIQTTAGDMLKLDQALSGGRLLRPETQERMYTAFKDPGWGIVWRLAEVEGQKVAWHGGETTGVSAMFRRYLRDRLTLVVLSNYHAAGRPLTKVVEPLLFGRPYELPRPTLGEFLFSHLKAKGVAETVKDFDNLLADNGYGLGSSDDLNSFGYELMDDGLYDLAVEILKQNWRLYPREANTHDSLGEAYLRRGDLSSARVHYQKALELDPKSSSARFALEYIDKRDK